VHQTPLHQLLFVCLFIVQLTLPESINAASKQPVIYILNVDTLEQIESSGFSLGEQLDQKANVRTTKDLYQKSPWYKSFVETIGKPIKHNLKTDQLPDIIPDDFGDIPDMVRLIRGFNDKGRRSSNDKKSGFYIHKLSNNSYYPYQVEYDGDEPRHFDQRWLYSPIATFKLVGISNRLDRVDFNPSSCGEVRFIYRLSYKTKTSSSSLPFFVNIVKKYPKENDCKGTAKNWLESGEMSANSAVNGPLKNLEFVQLELNFQSLRFTSGYMHGFGGQAMYMQRVFRAAKKKLVPVGLENTPDVLTLLSKPKKMQQLIDYLKQPANLNALDGGYLNIDLGESFLAKRSLSWSTLGRNRTANRPYSMLYKKYQKEFNSIDLKQLKFIKSHKGLVERLNNLTCAGCHQAGGAAGFHILGKANPNYSHPFNRQETPLSSHASAEITRRTKYLKALLSGKQPSRFRPHSILKLSSAGKTQYELGQAGSLCFSNEKHFRGSFGCRSIAKERVECVETVTVSGQEPLIGECVAQSKLAAGGVCWKGKIKEETTLPARRHPIPTYNFFAFQDRWQLTGATFDNKLKTAGGYKCVLPQSGAPLGRMSRKCTQAEERFENYRTSDSHQELCANQGGQGFDMCAARGDSGACLESKVARSMLDVCHVNRHCREDYTCQKFPDYGEISKTNYVRKKRRKLVNAVLPSSINSKNIARAQRDGVGFCVPTYFLFNLRADGHPNPLPGSTPSTPKVDRPKPLRGYKR